MGYRGQTKGVQRLNIAISGSGISELSAAWLPFQSHDIAGFEATDRISGKSTGEFKSLAGATLAVSLEPSGGSSTSLPNYPIVASSTTRQF